MMGEGRLALVAVCLCTAVPAAAQQHALETAAPFGAAAVDAGELSAITGRADTIQEVRAQNSSTVANNSVNGHSETGTINFDAGSFQAMNGLSLLSANTGNNVSINSSLNVNVAILPR